MPVKAHGAQQVTGTGRVCYRARGFSLASPEAHPGTEHDVQLDLLIHDARVVHPEGVVRADVGVRKGRIEAVWPCGQGCAGRAAASELDARGRLLFAGFIDTHAHLRTPGAPHKETWAHATRAAAAGGFTTLLDMPNTTPPTVNPEWLEAKRVHARAHARVHFGLYAGVTRANYDALCRIDEARAAVAFKVFLGESTGPLLVDSPVVVSRLARATRTLLAFHAESHRVLEAARRRFGARADHVRWHGVLRPPLAAEEAVAFVVGLARSTRRPVHVCHVSTRGEIALLAAARRCRAPISFEVCPHHLALTSHDGERLGNLAKVNPPLRSARDQSALWRALGGGLAQHVATDHAPHTLAEKARPYAEAPSGMPGLDTAYRVVAREARKRDFDWTVLARWLAARPARVYRLARKGRIAPGFDADLVLVDPNARPRRLVRRELHTRCGWSPWLGEWLPPPPDCVWVAGRLVARHGAVVDDRVRGTCVEVLHPSA